MLRYRFLYEKDEELSKIKNAGRGLPAFRLIIISVQ